jgi:hypothetical protein
MEQTGKSQSFISVVPGQIMMVRCGLVEVVVEVVEQGPMSSKYVLHYG